MKVVVRPEKRRGENCILTLFAGRRGDERPRPSEEENDGGRKASRRPHVGEKARQYEDDLRRDKTIFLVRPAFENAARHWIGEGEKGGKGFFFLARRYRR